MAKAKKPWTLSKHRYKSYQKLGLNSTKRHDPAALLDAAAEKGKSFLDLPNEIREMIYNLTDLHVQDVSITIDNHVNQRGRNIVYMSKATQIGTWKGQEKPRRRKYMPPVALFLIHPEVSQRAREIIYSQATFAFPSEHVLHHFMNMIGNNRHFIEYVDLPDLLCTDRAYNIWSFLCEYNILGRSLRSLPNLQELAIPFRYDNGFDMPKPCVCGNRWLYTICRRLQRIYSLLPRSGSWSIFCNLEQIYFTKHDAETIQNNNVYDHYYTAMDGEYDPNQLYKIELGHNGWSGRLSRPLIPNSHVCVCGSPYADLLIDGVHF